MFSAWIHFSPLCLSHFNWFSTTNNKMNPYIVFNCNSTWSTFIYLKLRIGLFISPILLYIVHTEREKHPPQIVLLTSFYRRQASKYAGANYQPVQSIQLVWKPGEFPAGLILQVLILSLGADIENCKSSSSPVISITVSFEPTWSQSQNLEEQCPRISLANNNKKSPSVGIMPPAQHYLWSSHTTQLSSEPQTTEPYPTLHEIKRYFFQISKLLLWTFLLYLLVFSQ